MKNPSLLLGLAAACGVVALSAALLWGPSGTKSQLPAMRSEEQAPTPPPAQIEGVRSVIEPNVSPDVESPVFEPYVPSPPTDTIEARLAQVEQMRKNRPPTYDAQGNVVPEWRVEVWALEAEWGVKLDDFARRDLELQAQAGWPDGQEPTFLRIAREYGYEPKQEDDSE